MEGPLLGLREQIPKERDKVCLKSLKKDASSSSFSPFSGFSLHTARETPSPGVSDGRGRSKLDQTSDKLFFSALSLLLPQKNGSPKELISQRLIVVPRERTEMIDSEWNSEAARKARPPRVRGNAISRCSEGLQLRSFAAFVRSRIRLASMLNSRRWA